MGCRDLIPFAGPGGSDLPKGTGSVCAREGNRAYMKVQDWKPSPSEEDGGGTQELPWVSTACRAPAGSHGHPPAREPLPETVHLFSAFPQLDSDQQLLRTAACAGGWDRPRQHHSRLSIGFPVLCPGATIWFCWLDAQ